MGCLGRLVWIEFMVLHLLMVLWDTVSQIQKEHCRKRWIIVLDEHDNFLVLL